ncbi:MAG: DUF2889 domain-containing protein [Actinomycetota bacterium]
MAAPPLPELPLIHQRTYDVKSFVEAPDRIRLRGSVQDDKPPGLYIEDDPEPLTIHHMIVELSVEVPSMEIVDADVTFDVHPHGRCPRIVDHYGELVGLSIARGFTHRVRELFGGPRGCTHTTALLQAMAPVAIQSLWSLRMHEARRLGAGQPVGPPRPMTPEERKLRMAGNINTCHVWAEDGDMVAEIEAGGEMEIPHWIIDRMRELGRDPEEWTSLMRG